MESIGDFILLLIQQFAGGPGPVENNLMRFGSAAIFWFALLLIAWSRQRNNQYPREKLLVLGFGFALLRELIMFGLTTNKLMTVGETVNSNLLYYPLEHGLAMTSIVVVSGAFLQYAIKDEKLSKNFIMIGLALAITVFAISLNTWPRVAENSPGAHFNETWESLAIHVFTIILILVAIVILMSKPDWLRVVVSVALGFFLISEALFLISNSLSHSTNQVLCPISNAFHILAIPIFGFVYIKEMSIEKKRAEEKLDDYRNHLEDLVNARTAMLSAQNEIANSLSRSLDLETILNMALDKVLAVLSMDVGLLFLLDSTAEDLKLGSYRGKLSKQDLAICIKEGCPYKKLSKQAIHRQAMVNAQTDETLAGYSHIKREQIKNLYSLPLISNDQIVGALTLGTKNLAPLDETDSELLKAICNQIGMAVENANLYQEAEIWAEELSTLHQASLNLAAMLDIDQIYREIAIQSARLTGRPVTCVVRWDGHSDTSEILSCVGIEEEKLDRISSDQVTSDFLANIFIGGESVAFNEANDDKKIPASWKKELDAESILCTPITIGDGLAELLIIVDQHKNMIWQSKDVELVESFISRASVALENANLYKQLEWAAALEERQRIASDMHDGLAQIIGLLGYKIDHVSELLGAGTDKKLSEALLDVRKTVNQAMVEARKSIYSLQSTPQPRKSLQEILTSQVKQWSAEWVEGSNISICPEFSYPEPLFLSPEKIIQIIPIIQEAVINARKHSGASQINIHGYLEDDVAFIQILDNGKGFDKNQLDASEEHHFGLKIMHARAARFGGELEVESKLNTGTTVTLSWRIGQNGDTKKSIPGHTNGKKLSALKEGEINV